MSPYRTATRCLLIASLLWASACDTSTGSLISEDVQGLLNPQSDQSDSSGGTTNNASNGVAESLRLTSITSTPSVTSVSPTISIRGDNIILLIHGEHLSDKLRVELDNETSPCEVSEIGNTSTGIIITNLIEAACTTRSISNRMMSVFDANGNEIAGSPLNFTGTNITLSTSAASDTTANSTAAQNVSPSTQSTAIQNGSLVQPSNTNNTPPTYATPTLSAPKNLQIVNDSGSIHLSWDSVDRAQGYSIYVSNATNPQPGVIGTNTYISYAPTIQITDFDTDQTHYIVVKAFLNNTESARSAELRVDVNATLKSSYAAPILISSQDNIPANAGIYLTDDAYQAVDQSSDGRFTVFLSKSSNLVAVSTESHIQVYLHDRKNNSVTLISQSTAGAVSNADTSSPKISADGSVVTFVSAATNLDDQFSVVDGVSNVFIRDLSTNTTQLISRSARTSAASANADSFNPIIDGNGENIVFTSVASDLTTNVSSQATLFFHFKKSNNTSRSVIIDSSTQLESNSYTYANSNALSADGEFLFYSHHIPGRQPSLHRLSLSTQAQLNLRVDSSIELYGSYIRSVSDDGATALISYSNDQRAGLYDFVTHTFLDIGKWSNHTIPKDLSGDGKYAVFWSQDDLLPDNDIDNHASGTHFVLDTETNALQEYSHKIHSISGDGNILLYTQSADVGSDIIQLKSVQR